MGIFWRIVNIERLIYGRGVYKWVLFSCVPLAILLYRAFYDWKNSIDSINQFSFMYIALVSLVALLTMFHMFREERAHHIQALMETIPYSASGKMLGRFLIASTTVTVVALVPAYVYVFANLLDSQPVETPAVLLLISLLISVYYALSIGCVLGCLTTSKMGYAFAFIVWFVHIYGGLGVSNHLPVAFHLVSNFLLFDLKSSGIADNQFGFILPASIWVHRFLYAVLTVFNLAIAIIILKKRRKEKTGKPARIFAISLASLALIILIMHVWMHGRLLDVEPVVGREEYRASYVIDRYDIELTLDGQDRASIQADLDISQLQDSPLRFTLNHAFDVQHIDLDQSRVDYLREGDMITIVHDTDSDRTYQLTFVYTGKINEYRVNHYSGKYNPYRNLTLYNSTNQNHFNLMSTFAWYPLPGHVSLLQNIRREGESPLYVESNHSFPASDFNVQVHAPKSFELYSTLPYMESDENQHHRHITFRGENRQGVSLLGGSFRLMEMEEDEFRTRMIVSKYHDMAYIKKLTAFFQMVRKEIARITQLEGNPVLSFVAIDTIKNHYLWDSAKVSFYKGDYTVIDSFLFSGHYSDYLSLYRAIEYELAANQWVPKNIDQKKLAHFKITLTLYTMDQYALAFVPESLYGISLDELEEMQKQLNGMSDLEQLAYLQSLYEQLG